MRIFKDSSMCGKYLLSLFWATFLFSACGGEDYPKLYNEPPQDEEGDSTKNTYEEEDDGHLDMDSEDDTEEITDTDTDTDTEDTDTLDNNDLDTDRTLRHQWSCLICEVVEDHANGL